MLEKQEIRPDPQTIVQSLTHGMQTLKREGHIKDAQDYADARQALEENYALSATLRSQGDAYADALAISLDCEQFIKDSLRAYEDSDPVKLFNDKVGAL